MSWFLVTVMVALGGAEPVAPMQPHAAVSAALDKQAALVLIQQTLMAWPRASAETRNLACVIMLRNLEAGGMRAYDGDAGHAKLLVEALALRVCMDESAKAGVGIGVGEAAALCILLMDAEEDAR